MRRPSIERRGGGAEEENSLFSFLTSLFSKAGGCPRVHGGRLTAIVCLVNHKYL